MEMESTTMPSVQTRASSSTSIADINIMAELEGIPVNILNVANTSNKYLSCKESGETLYLSNKDDGSGRQRWIFEYGGIAISNGHSGISSTLVGALTPNSMGGVGSTAPTSVSLKLWQVLPGSSLWNPWPIPRWSIECNGEEDVRFYYLYADPNQPLMSRPYYLSTSSSNSTNLSLVDSNDLSAFSQWNISPVGEFELIDLQYVRTTVDDFDVKTAICDNDKYENATSRDQVWDYSISMPYVEVSRFSNTEGVSVTMSKSASVGLPNVVGEGSSINFNATIQQQSTKSTTFGEETQSTITRTRTAHVTVAPNTTVRMETIMFTYEGTLTYVATMRKIGTNDTFKVKGKWTGSCFSKFEAHVYEVPSNKLLESYIWE